MASAGVLFSTSLRSAIARSNLRRCPSKTPSFSRSWSVRSGRTLRSIPFSLKRRAYCPRPSFSSQSAICRIAVPQAVSPQPEIVFFFDPDEGEPTPIGRLAYPGRPRRVDRSGLETYGNLWRWTRGNVWMLIKPPRPGQADDLGFDSPANDVEYRFTACPKRVKLRR